MKQLCFCYVWAYYLLVGVYRHTTCMPLAAPNHSNKAPYKVSVWISFIITNQVIQAT